MKTEIYQTGFTKDGSPLIGGIWKMKTEVGFPVDLSILEIQQRGGAPDWAEMLADAGSVDLPAFEFDNAVHEMRQVIPILADEIMHRFKLWFSSHAKHGEDFSQTCKALLAIKRNYAVA
jgi:hypothetical protein